MNIKLRRDTFTDVSSIGKLTIDDDPFHSDTLEDKDRGLLSSTPLTEIVNIKIQNATCIPYGTYQVIIDMSTRFKRLMPLLVDVPGFAGIRIHNGNTDVDTDGCILLGQGRAKDFISNSNVTFAAFFKILQDKINAGEKVHITISK